MKSKKGANASAGVSVLDQEGAETAAGEHTNYHAQIKQEQLQYQSKMLSEPIPEVSEHDESQSFIKSG